MHPESLDIAGLRLDWEKWQATSNRTLATIPPPVIPGLALTATRHVSMSLALSVPEHHPAVGMMPCFEGQPHVMYKTYLATFFSAVLFPRLTRAHTHVDSSPLGGWIRIDLCSAQQYQKVSSTTSFFKSLDCQRAVHILHLKGYSSTPQQPLNDHSSIFYQPLFLRHVR
jgi:hypothetical protein